MKTVLAATVAVLAMTTPAAAAEQSFMVTGFDSVSIAGPHKVIITKGKGQSVRAVGERADLDRLDIRVENNALKIGEKKEGSWLSWNDGKAVTIYVTAQNLHEARLAGSGNVAIDRMKGDDVTIKLAGSGDLSVGDVTAGKLTVAIAGSGDLALAGACTDASVSIAGSGNVVAPGLKCQTFIGKVSGSGDIAADVARAATLTVMGSGNITITGEPRCEIKTMGSGRVRCGKSTES